MTLITCSIEEAQAFTSVHKYLEQKKDLSIEKAEQDVIGIVVPERVQPPKQIAAWSDGEDAKLDALVKMYGENWDVVSGQFTTRSRNEVLDRYYSHIKYKYQELQYPDTFKQRKKSPIKKSSGKRKRGLPRNRTPWTGEEDAKLTKLIRKHGLNWDYIVPQMVGRSDGGVKARYHMTLKEHLHRDTAPAVKISPKVEPVQEGRVYKNGWTDEEETILIQLIKTYGRDWKLIADQMDNRTISSIKQRYRNIEKRPGFQPIPEAGEKGFGVAWDPKDTRLLIALIDKHGRRWQSISAHFPHKTVAALVAKYHRLVRSGEVERDDTYDERTRHRRTREELEAHFEQQNKYITDNNESETGSKGSKESKRPRNRLYGYISDDERMDNEKKSWKKKRKHKHRSYDYDDEQGDDVRRRKKRRKKHKKKKKSKRKRYNDSDEENSELRAGQTQQNHMGEANVPNTDPDEVPAAYSKWNDDEDQKLIYLKKKHGSVWKPILEAFWYRTKSSVQGRWANTIKHRLAEEGILDQIVGYQSDSAKTSSSSKIKNHAKKPKAKPQAKPRSPIQANPRSPTQAKPRSPIGVTFEELELIPKKRTRLTDGQKARLEKAMANNEVKKGVEGNIARERIAKEIGLPVQKVRRWFLNRWYAMSLEK